MPITADSYESITQLWSQRLSSWLRRVPGCIRSSVTWPLNQYSCLSLDKSPWPMHVHSTRFLRAHQDASFRATKKAAVGLARTCCSISGMFYLLPLTRSTNFKENASAGADYSALHLFRWAFLHWYFIWYIPASSLQKALPSHSIFPKSWHANPSWRTQTPSHLMN